MQHVLSLSLSFAKKEMWFSLPKQDTLPMKCLPWSFFFLKSSLFSLTYRNLKLRFLSCLVTKSILSAHTNTNTQKKKTLSKDHDFKPFKTGSFLLYNNPKENYKWREHVFNQKYYLKKQTTRMKDSISRAMASEHQFLSAFHMSDFSSKRAVAVIFTSCASKQIGSTVCQKCVAYRINVCVFRALSSDIRHGTHNLCLLQSTPV